MNILKINFGILFILAIIQTYLKNVRLKRSVYLLMCADLLFLAITRAPNVGADWYSYVYSYYRWTSMTWPEILGSLYLFRGSECGYTILNKCISLISSSPQALVVALALFVFPLQFLFYYKFSIYPGLSLLVFVAMDGFEFGYTYLRQACALTFVLMAFRYILKRHFIKFIICVFMGFLFHRSACIVIPLYFLYTINVNRKVICAMFVISVTLYLYGEYVLKLVAALFGKAYVNEFVAGRNRYIFMWIMVVVLYELMIKKILCHAFYDKLKINNHLNIKDTYRFLFWCLLMASSIQALAPVANVFVRATEYFNGSMYILFSLTPTILRIKKLGEWPCFCSIVAMGIVMFFFYCHVLAGDYTFMWS